jgi:hypothetical protein
MEQKLLDVLNMVYKQDFSGVVGQDRLTLEPMLLELEEKKLIAIERVKSGCGGCTGCGVQLFPEIVDAGIEMLKQHGMIEEEK